MTDRCHAAPIIGFSTVAGDDVMASDALRARLSVAPPTGAVADHPSGDHRQAAVCHAAPMPAANWSVDGGALPAVISALPDGGDHQRRHCTDDRQRDRTQTRTAYEDVRQQ